MKSVNSRTVPALLWRGVFILALAACAAVVTSAPHIRAQESDATPVPTEAPPADPHSYDDAAMHFEAPSDYRLLGEHHIPLRNVGDPAVVAAWVKLPGDPHERDLYITVESFNGNASDFEATAESDLRDKVGDSLVNHKTEVTTNNGMPAYLMSVSYGDGFDAKKQFELVWADGQRGVTIAFVGPTGETNETEARAVLMSHITAVQYPLGRP